ncbi:MAG: ABC transporter substrate-binding protein [Sulfurimonas sp.]|nr:ABC transporter substrate-binding protein [Sulfurimonas sp.]
MIFTASYASAASLQKIVVQLEWKYQFQFAGFIMAKELGFYKELGLDVLLQEYTKHVDVADVVDGKIDYLVSNSLLLYNEDGLYDLTLLATYFQTSPLVFAVQPDILKVQDLKGKKIVINNSERTNSSLAVLLKHYAIDINNTTFIQPNYDMNDFIQKRVDAVAAFTSDELFELDKKGVDYNIIDPVDYGYTTTAINLFANYDKVINNPQEITNFLEATKKGWKYALNHIDEVTALIHEKYRPKKSLDALKYEANVTKKLMTESLYDIGEINSANLVASYEQLVKLGLFQKSIYDLHMLSLETYKETQHLYLSHDERKYLKQKKEITICVDPKWKPFEWIDENGEYKGMGADYFDAFISQVGIPYHLHKTQNWAQTLDSLKSGKCDLLPMVSITQPRKKFLSFTDAYYKMPYVVATTLDKPFIADISTQLDKKFAVIRDSAVIDYVKKLYPSIKFVKVSTVAQGISFVREKKVYGLINTTAVYIPTHV